ncbi:crossover junction endodeoxyribonuclease RuvC [Rhodoluna sp. KAS3]|uniref:crossover junction endodeoxyribonuclease RuvC n=1 Tax=Rhodoluna sp. KAS3 TaxID=942880 RepID=UPI0022321C8C|nr:crossover junction endodeoxyribonuclease RuvC [Rhodoluna sp. KAS3]BDS49064.1 crossover junction endodeoxyribonuclease RuvC [Rhodoluna sp. KAS3]
MTTRIMGVDPGLTRCGVGVVELGASKKVSFIAVDTLRSSTADDLPVRLHQLATEIEGLIALHKPNALAIERVFSQANLRSVMGTAQISGIVMYLAEKHGIPVVMHTPTEVKAAVTGSGRADKAQVGNMVAKILGLAEVPKPADAADSLAIAICHAWRGGVIESGGTLTPAQKAWHTAIKSAKNQVS